MSDDERLRAALLDAAASILAWAGGFDQLLAESWRVPLVMIAGVEGLVDGWVEWDRTSVRVLLDDGREVEKDWPWAVQALWERDNVASLF